MTIKAPRTPVADFDARIRLRLATTLATFLTAGIAAPAWAAELAGVTLPEQMTVEGRTLVLNGMGVREATWLKINVYVAGLYLEEKSSDADPILRDERPKRIVFVFVRPVNRKRIVKELDDSLKANAGENSAALQDRVATLRGWIPDTVGKGAEMMLTHLPGKGVDVVVNGEARGTIPGADFARALFTVWLGTKPPNHALKTGLLGQS